MFHGTMTLNKDRNELSTKKTYYNDRDYRKNALIKNKNLKIKRLLTDLLVTWPPSWIAMVKRGLMSQASPNELREFLSSSFSLFHEFHTFQYFHMHKNSE